MKKRITKTLRGDSLPPQQSIFTDDSKNGFEIDATEAGEKYGCILVEVFADGKWVEVVTFYFNEEGA